jgi:dipeptidase E
MLPALRWRIRAAPALRRLVEEGTITNALALDDGAAAHFVNGELANVVCSRPHARAYKVGQANGHAVETVLNLQIVS